MDFTCGECGVDGQSGIAGVISVSRPIGASLTLGMEGTFAAASFDGPTQDLPDAKLFGPMATLGLRRGARVPVWATLGLGWLWYSGIGPNSNGPGASLRVGADLPMGGLGALTPYGGYVSMLAHDGPEILTGRLPSSPVARTRLTSFELGVGVSFGL
jgi:hypothetical protein